MNKRMIELANRANEDVGYTFKLEDANQIHELMEKFAELIVKECAGIACQHMELNEGTDYNVGGKIKQHFGVEE